MDIVYAAEQAQYAYEDARTSVTATVPEQFELADALVKHVAALVEECRVARQEATELEEQVCPDPHEHEDSGTGLAQLIREEHDIAHRDAWAVCPFPPCRAASRLTR